MLGESTPSLGEASSPERGKRPAEECSSWPDDMQPSCRDRSPAIWSGIHTSAPPAAWTRTGTTLWKPLPSMAYHPTAPLCQAWHHRLQRCTPHKVSTLLLSQEATGSLRQGLNLVCSTMAHVLTIANSPRLPGPPPPGAARRSCPWRGRRSIAADSAACACCRWPVLACAP